MRDGVQELERDIEDTKTRKDKLEELKKINHLLRASREGGVVDDGFVFNEKNSVDAIPLCSVAHKCVMIVQDWLNQFDSWSVVLRLRECREIGFDCVPL